MSFEAKLARLIDYYTIKAKFANGARKQKQTSSLNYFTTKCKFYFFSQRNMFKKQPQFVLKYNTRWHEGFKLPLFMLLCKFRPILPRSQTVFSTTFIGYLCALLLQLCFCYYGFDFLPRFHLETKESQSIKLRGN